MNNIHYDYDSSWTPESSFIEFELIKCERYELADNEYDVQLDKETNSFLIRSRYPSVCNDILDTVVSHIVSNLPDHMSHNVKSYCICIVNRLNRSVVKSNVLNAPCFSPEQTDSDSNMAIFASPSEESAKRKLNRERAATKAEGYDEKPSSLRAILTPMIN